MVDTANTIGPAPEQTEPRSRAPSRGYQTAQDARNLAAFTRFNSSAQSRAALERLDKLLKEDAPLLENAPPGYYFDGRF
jgi:hypothetical protein